MQKIAFIGIGNMGLAMTKALLNSKNKNDIIFTRKNEQEAINLEKELGIKYIKDLDELLKVSKYIILAIKPQVYTGIFEKIKEYIRGEHIIISLAPGISIQSISKSLNTKRVVRAMPNTPALVGEAMTGLAYEESLYTDEELKNIEDIFLSIGEFIKVEEKDMNAVVCMSGSAPAYMYEFVDSLASMGLKYGLSKATAIKLVAKTMLGSAKMILETGEHPQVLKDRVSSPAGTTIAGILALEEYAFRKAIQKASEACYNRCKELADN